MKIDFGDRVTFGKEWCEANGFSELLGETWTIGVVEYEYDNGLYVDDLTCPGIIFDDEGYSVWYLFGDDFENLMDCSVVKATDEERESVIETYNKKIEKESEEYVAYFEKLLKDSQK